MQIYILVLVFSIYLRTSYSAACEVSGAYKTFKISINSSDISNQGDDCQTQCAAYCFGVLNPCMSNLANLQRRTEACEAAVAIARLALNDRRLDTFGSLLTMQPEKKNNSQLLLAPTPEARKLERNDHFQQLGSKYYNIEKERKKKWVAI